MVITMRDTSILCTNVKTLAAQHQWPDHPHEGQVIVLKGQQPSGSAEFDLSPHYFLKHQSTSILITFNK